jgi:hypothetical protein
MDGRHNPRETAASGAYRRNEAALERILGENREIARELARFRKRAVERALAAGETIPWETLPGRIAQALETCGFSRPEPAGRGTAGERTGARRKAVDEGQGLKGIRPADRRGRERPWRTG